ANELFDNVSAEAAILPAVGDQHAEFGFAKLLPREAPDGEKFRFAGLRIPPLGHECDLAVVVDAAPANEPLMRDSRVELGNLKIAEVHRAIREGTVKFH